MKRVWFAVIFIIITVVACVTEQIYISGFCNELNGYSESAIVAVNNNDKTAYEENIKKISNCWKKKNDLLYCISNHVILDELSYRINSAKGIKTAVFEIKAVIYAIYENNRIKLSNIL